MKIKEMFYQMYANAEQLKEDEITKSLYTVNHKLETLIMLMENALKTQAKWEYSDYKKNPDVELTDAMEQNMTFKFTVPTDFTIHAYKFIPLEHKEWACNVKITTINNDKFTWDHLIHRIIGDGAWLESMATTARLFISLVYGWSLTQELL